MVDKGINIFEKKRNICIYVIVLFVCAYVLAPIFRLAVYNRPAGDDYNYGMWTVEVVRNGGGILSLIKAAAYTVKYVYVSFSGLYTSAFVLALHPGIWGEKMYALSTWIVVGVIYFLTFWSVFILNKKFIQRSVLFVAAASMAVVTMLVLWLPDPHEGLFWYNGAMNYMPFAFANVLNLCLLLEVDESLCRKKGKILLAVSMLLSFLISGGNHVTSFANILMLFFAAGYKITKKKFYILLPLATAVLGFVIMYFSPGTQWRASHFAGENVSQGVVATIVATLKHWIYVADDWISLVWLISMVMMTPVAIEFAVKNSTIFSKHFPVIPILLSGAIVSGMFCVPYLPMGFFGAGRVTNVIWITFMILSWFIYFLIWGWLAANDYVNFEKMFEKKHTALIGGIVVIVCLFTLFRCHDKNMSVSMRVHHDLETGIAEEHGRQMDERIALYRDENLDVVVVSPIQNISEMLYVEDILENPNDWPNDAMGEWYGGKKIYMIPEAE